MCTTDMPINPADIDSYAAAEDYLLAVPKFTSKHSLQETEQFLALLGHPEEKAKSVHVAGTNGKGSVCAYMDAVLRTAGFRTGLFTSPHLVTMRERICIDGEMVSEEAFVHAFRVVAEALHHLPVALSAISYHPTFFEYLFFMAAVLFAEAGVEYQIWETGLGGRLDATNTIKRKEICVITSIGYDHTQYLGDTLSAIAREKAGILRADTPAVYWAEEKEVADTLADCVKNVGAKPFPVLFSDITDMRRRNKSIDFSLRTTYYGNIGLCLATGALYQAENAALAVAGIAQLPDRERITAAQIQEGIANTHWAARMEEIFPNVFLDGAHNADGIAAFLETVRSDGAKGERRLLFSMVKDKQVDAAVKLIAQSRLFHKIGLVRIADTRGLSLAEMKKCFAQYTQENFDIITYETMDAALAFLQADLQPQDRAYIAGSLYLAGEVKSRVRRLS